MTNTEYLYQAMKKYQTARSAARDEYFQTMKRLESAKGSAYYTEERDKAMKKRTAAVEVAQAEARRTVENALSCMNSAITARKMTAPTEDQLRILTMLNMRTSITKAELDTAANAMEGNGTALAVLEDIARKHEILGANYGALVKGGLSPDKANQVLREITTACYKRINDTVGANRAAAAMAKFHNQRYGGSPAQEWESANASVSSKGTPGDYMDLDSLPQEAPYQGEADFYGGIVSIPFNVLSSTLN